MPKWEKTNHTSHLSTTNLKNNFNISLEKGNKLNINLNGSTQGANLHNVSSNIGQGYTLNNGLVRKKTNGSLIKKQF